MKKRRLPLGLQTFSEIAEDGLVYADKTGRIYDLVTGFSKFVFLDRPRRIQPVGLLNHFKNHGDFETYWFATGRFKVGGK
ncbi:MAG: AAA family ATPase [Spirochaetaceae bacterium]|jgi:hypothetical protein|nr:AAA family ATPase [Spirochaetaceae bacterium]